MTEQTILILGGGMGGIVTARELRRHIGSRHRIILVDRNPIHSFTPSLVWVLPGWRTPSLIQRPLTALEAHGINFHHADILGIDTAGKTVTTNRGELDYDYCVIALGAEPVPVPVGTAAHTFHDAEGTIAFRRGIQNFRGGGITIRVSSASHPWPFAPFETALVLEAYYTQRAAGSVRVTIHTPEEHPLGFLGEPVRTSFLELVQERGISLVTAEPPAPTTGEQLTAILPEFRSPAVIRKSRLAGPDGWIHPHDRTFRTAEPEVFAIGDCISMTGNDGTPLPRTGTFAAGAGEVVAAAIAHELGKIVIGKKTTGSGFYFVETGNGRAVYIHGNFYSSAFTYNAPNVTYHWGKVVAEKYWLWRWF